MQASGQYLNLGICPLNVDQKRPQQDTQWDSHRTQHNILQDLYMPQPNTLPSTASGNPSIS